MNVPSKVRIVDITARDGLQNIKEWIPTEDKISILNGLATAGVTKVEATSFVSPKAIPQMADAAQIITHCRQNLSHVEAVALVPNFRGAENAVKTDTQEISYVISASIDHNKANINRTHEESLQDLAAITKAFPDLKVNLSLSAVFGCPFSGEVPVEKTLWIIQEALNLGASSVTLCDTIGVANPYQVQSILKSVRQKFATLPIAMHMHDTHGMGLANIFAALQMGIDQFETAAGGLGGCPFAPGAAGNTATEDTVNMLERMGIDTGINLEALLDVTAMIREKITPNILGRLSMARSYSEFCFYQNA